MLTQPFIEKIINDSETRVTFDFKRCLRARLSKNNCACCLEVCRSGALELHGRKIYFTAHKCTSCLQCVAVCPGDSCRHPMDFDLLLQTLAARDKVLLGCLKGGQDHDHHYFTVPCIGIFSESMLAAMNSVAKGRCNIDISRCAECSNSHCLTRLYDNLRNMIDRMAENGVVRLNCLADPGSGLSAGKNSGRRSFLRFMQKTIVGLGKDAVSIRPGSEEKQDNSQSKKWGRKSTVLQLALRLMPVERVSARQLLLSYHFTVAISEQCDCCPSCTGMCPTGALKRKKEERFKSLSFTSSKCSGCGLCVEFCRKDAVILENDFSGEPARPREVRRIKSC